MFILSCFALIFATTFNMSFCVSTRVVQKLIETVKTRQQISLIISALEPGFLALIKDLNGNHVVQRCLQCFTAEDSKVSYSSNHSL